MRKPWQTPAWRKERSKLIKDKVCEWCGSKEYLTIHHPQEKNSLTDEEYLSLEGIIILCRRCHLAVHRGMHLCPKCKKHYTHNQYDVCFNCLPESHWKKTATHDNEIIDINLPCGFKTKMKRETYEMEIPCGEINCPKDLYFGDCEDFLKEEYGPDFDFKEYMIKRDIIIKKDKERVAKREAKRETKRLKDLEDAEE